MADVDRLYVPKKQGRNGLMQLEAANAVQITKLVEYVDRKEDPLIQVVRTQQQNTDSAVLKLDGSRQKYREKQEK
jgi:repressor of nif and glnA expression